MENNSPAQIPTMPLVSLEKAYQYMQSLEYSDAEGIMFLEQQLYNLLTTNPEDSNFLALLLHEQIMNNRGQRARSIAYKIWENGGINNPNIELMYINDLINLCMLDMAGAALAPSIADLENADENTSKLLLKYAIISGNMTLLARLVQYLPDNKNTKILEDWLSMSDYLQANNHIPNIMKRITDKVKDSVLSFSYKLYSDREFPEVEFIFYVGSEINNHNDLQQRLNMDISSYCASHKIQDLINLSNLILPINRYQQD